MGFAADTSKMHNTSGRLKWGIEDPALLAAHTRTVQSEQAPGVRARAQIASRHRLSPRVHCGGTSHVAARGGSR